MEEISNNLEYNNNNFEKTCKVDEENILLQENNFQEFNGKMQEITHFSIFGERCSGTNLLKNLIETNFKLEYNYDISHKHFFCFTDFENKNTENTLILCIVRNFFEWIMSFYEKQHHINKSVHENVNNIKSFLNQEVHSYDSDGNEILQDWNYVSGTPYKNLFELRKYKILYMTDILPSKTKFNYIVLYENICNTTFQVNFLERLEREFQLKKKNNSSTFLPIYYNAQIYNNQNIKKAFVPKKLNERAKKCGINPEIINFINDNIDHQVEKLVKYDTTLFKNKFQLNLLVQENLTVHEKVKKKEMELNNMILNRNKKLLDTKVLKKMILSPEKENEKEIYSLMKQFENNNSNNNNIINENYSTNNNMNDNNYIDGFYENLDNITINQYLNNHEKSANSTNVRKKNLVQMKTIKKNVN